MSLLPMLVPIYLAGLAALSIPLLLHFIRRSPKGRVPFSTLMFLQASPPRLTRKSRLDNLLLLLLRALALALIAIAFCRPFFRFSTQSSIDAATGRRVVILVDTSASMQRGDLWQQAQDRVSEALNELDASDRSCLIGFDHSPRTLISFEQNASEFDPQIYKVLIKDAIRGEAPGWQGTDLGAALLAACGLLEEQHTVAEVHDRSRLQIVLISDLQAGSNLAALQSFVWPENVLLKIVQLDSGQTTNATLNTLQPETDGAAETDMRVRVANNPDSETDQFQIGWLLDAAALDEASDADKRDWQKRLNVQVPPGESRIVKMKLPSTDLLPVGIQLFGDQADFDNTFYLPPQSEFGSRIEFLPDTAGNSKEGVLFYFQKIFEGDDRNVVEAVDEQSLLTAARSPELLVIAAAAVDASKKILKYLDQGGRVLVVLTGAEMQETLRRILQDDAIELQESKIDRFALWGDIEFRHPLFAPFADPKYNDFTASHIWKYRQLKWPALDSASTNVPTNILVRYDTGDAALVHRQFGKGDLYVMTSGWNPADSQLAVSRKFVPLMFGIMGRRLTTQASLLETVGATVKLKTDFTNSDRVTLATPTGDTELLAVDEQQTVRFLPDRIGVYRVESGDAEQAVVVNLDLNESKTSPLEIEQLEQLGVALGDQPSEAAVVEHERQMQNEELEQNQKAWSKLIFAVLGLLFVETIVAGVLARKQNTLLGEA